MQIDSVRDLLVHELRDIRSFEQQLTEGLPAMARAARSRELKEAFTQHLKTTTRQKERVEQLLEELEAPPGGVKCQGMAGVLKEAAEVMAFEGPAAVKDLALIGAAGRVEHYEMAAYAGARRLAEALGLDKVAGLLAEIHDEEAEADDVLTSIAEQIQAAAGEPQGGERTSR